MLSFLFLGVNLIVGTETGLYLLDRSGYGKGEDFRNVFILLVISFSCQWQFWLLLMMSILRCWNCVLLNDIVSFLGSFLLHVLFLSNLFACLSLFLSVFQLISRRRFQQIDVLEGINVLISISGKNVIHSFVLLVCIYF